MNVIFLADDSAIAFDELCALREKVRHLRLELNQLKRSHANHVTNGQLMIREAAQRITSAIDAFAQHSKKEEEARSKRTSALAQAWALHLATLDKLESEIRLVKPYYMSWMPKASNIQTV